MLAIHDTFQQEAVFRLLRDLQERHHWGEQIRRDLSTDRDAVDIVLGYETFDLVN